MNTTQQIVVSRGAPGWPAMVKKERREAAEKLKEEISMQSTSVTAASLWLKRKTAEPKIREAKSMAVYRPTKFAPKIVRQCTNCQILYTNYHICQVEA